MTVAVVAIIPAQSVEMAVLVGSGDRSGRLSLSMLVAHVVWMLRLLMVIGLLMKP